MGKSDVSHLKPSGMLFSKLQINEANPQKLFTIDSQQTTKVSYKTPNEICNLPPGMELLGNQVGGHMHNGKTLGMLKCSGMVLKPILKNAIGQTEIEFYENLEKTKDETMMFLREFVPKYFGTKIVHLNNKDVKFIILEDLTRGFKEPCIIDIKIGKRTWDPLASYSKIINEDKKYQDTKRELGISIPGLMVHNISNGRVYKYGKDYGKSLTKDSIKEAIGKFLNADFGLSRDLLLLFLVELWKILRWVRTQGQIRLYSSSILLVYDARRLKQYISNNNGIHISKSAPSATFTQTKTKTNLYRPISIMKLNEDFSCTGFSGQLTKDGPILSSIPSAAKLARLTESMRESKVDSSENIGNLRRVHSFQNNYDKDLQHMRREYMDMLDDLVHTRNEQWASVKMIDFAHVFPSERGRPDDNYLEGINSLVKLLESFLSETI